MKNTNTSSETLTMTRGLLEDFQRFAKQNEQERIVSILQQASLAWGHGTATRIVIDKIINQVKGE
jgi:hypothetical protein